MFGKSKKTKRAYIYSAESRGIFAQIKAYNKANALKCFQSIDNRIKLSDLSKVNILNPQQVPIEELNPTLFS